MIQPKIKINKKKKKDKREKAVIGFIYLILIFAIVVLFFTAKSMFFSKNTFIETTNQEIMQTPGMKKMSLTSYDKELARQMMDKDGDGKCDACGMSIEMCIDSGMMQCSGMDPDASIGILQSQHIHADWKIYINGEILNFDEKDHMSRMRANLPVSSFIHVDSGAPAPEKTGDILHMHATGVPLWIFFESIELKLPDEIKVYVNEKEISDYKNYVFNDLDKILITDSKGDLQQQLNSITDYAKNH
ncbi:hypothetical protein HYS72_02550 [Candidatus Pacearchaeota archaeon]|nr:hypothetical protein [Candidatus Pacearchaeota archaeon]MBI2056657.1 hypothetical protein [Candidatus Pacearchaeota archaeon]